MPHGLNDVPVRSLSSAPGSTELTTSELWMVAINTLIPSIAFGFMDNFIMIIAGD